MESDEVTVDSGGGMRLSIPLISSWVIVGSFDLARVFTCFSPSTGVTESRGGICLLVLKMGESIAVEITLGEEGGKVDSDLSVSRK